MRDWENGEGGEGRGTIVGSSGECIGLPICCTLPVSDLVVVCCQSGSPLGMSFAGGPSGTSGIDAFVSAGGGGAAGKTSGSS